MPDTWLSPDQGITDNDPDSNRINRNMDMLSLQRLFEAHLTVRDLQRSMTFFGQVLGLELAEFFPDRKVAFYWVGKRGDSMLGLWEVGTGPQSMHPYCF